MYMYIYTCMYNVLWLQLIVHYLILLCSHTITVLPLSIVYFVSEAYCTQIVLHSISLQYTYKCNGNSHIAIYTVQCDTMLLLRSTVEHHLIKVLFPSQYMYMYNDLIEPGNICFGIHIFDSKYLGIHDKFCQLICQ